MNDIIIRLFPFDGLIMEKLALYKEIELKVFYKDNGYANRKSNLIIIKMGKKKKKKENTMM